MAHERWRRAELWEPLLRYLGRRGCGDGWRLLEMRRHAESARHTKQICIYYDDHSKNLPQVLDKTSKNDGVIKNNNAPINEI